MQRSVKVSTEISRRKRWSGATNPRIMQPSSARRRACSQARAARAASIVPPTLPSGPAWAAVSQVFTTRLVPASRR